MENCYALFSSPHLLPSLLSNVGVVHLSGLATGCSRRSHGVAVSCSRARYVCWVRVAKGCKSTWCDVASDDEIRLPRLEFYALPLSINDALYVL